MLAGVLEVVAPAADLGVGGSGEDVVDLPLHGLLDAEDVEVVLGDHPADAVAAAVPVVRRLVAGDAQVVGREGEGAEGGG